MKKLSGLLIVLVLIITTAFPFLLSCSQQPAATSSQAPAATTVEAKTLTIGCLVDLTGWHAPFDIVAKSELELVAEMWNEKGGLTINGQKYNVKLVFEDGKSTLEGIAAATNKLIYDQGCKFLVGPGAYLGQAVSPIVAQAKVLDVLGYCTVNPGELDATTPYTFLGCDATLARVPLTIDAGLKSFPNIKTICIVQTDDGTVKRLIPYTVKAFESRGLKQVGNTVLYAADTQDYNPIAAQVKLIDADAVFVPNSIPNMAAGIIKSLRQAGYNKPLLTTLSTRTDTIRALAGKENVFNYVTLGVVPGASGNPAIMETFLNRLMQKNGKDVAFTLNVTNSLWVLLDVLQKTQSLDPTVVKQKWETELTDFNTLFGPGKIGGELSYGIKNHAVITPMAYQKVDANGKDTFDWITTTLP